MKFLKVLSLIFVLSMTTNANAVLIDNGYYTTDTNSGLDWLDLSITDGVAYNDALIGNNGWSYASASQVSNLIDTAFVGYYDTSSNGYSQAGNFGSSIYNGYANQNTDVDTFISLFGSTYNYGSGDNTSAAAYGIVLDGNELNLSGAYSYDTIGDDYSVVYNDYYYNYSWVSTTPEQNFGIYLVRDTVSAPEPSTLFLMSLALIGLLGASRRKL